ncbi:2-oxoglutarate/malate transporter (plasmid) [Streptomyces sp. NBC_01591]|uniref:2-oxoglutarate/malate transporter n=1 Tax=Streptomyces sp. NBC_01591 TaxID=2975888 RepID=UPI002DD7C2D8|nr:2-oxoglutarate/malate transporter [Streptomyces sp. NBC_01591]WSD74367.1 2-oxoglutarate/malate transporter [Streptomyces sp. NBC_01591]
MADQFKLTTSSFPRIGGIAALGFAAMITLSNVIMVPAGLPLTGTETGEVTEFFAAEGVAVGIGSALTPAAWILATLFGAGALVALRRSERDRGEAWSLLGLAGLVLQNVTFAGVVATRLALTSTAPRDPSATAALWALHDAVFTLNGTFLALALLGLSIGGLHTGLTRPWHAGLGLLAAVLQFSSATLAHWVIDNGGALGLLGLAGWLLWVVWIVVYGITLIRQPPHPGPPEQVVSD